MMETALRLLSLPRVKGTTQKVHILLHPRMIETNAETPLLLSLTGDISAYVSSRLSKTFTAFCPVCASSTKLGKVLYASGPTTKSTSFSSSSNLAFRRSAIQPRTPISIPGFSSFSFLKSVSLLRMVCSAFSRIEQVLIKIKSASSELRVAPNPSSFKMEATISESLKFIAQP